MNPLLVAGYGAMLMVTAVALAQPSTSQTTTSQTTITTGRPMTPIPEIIAPPAGTLSTTTLGKRIDPDGTQTITNETRYRNSTGVAQDSVSQSTRFPPSVEITTKQSETVVTQ